MKIQVRKPFFPHSSILKIQKNINQSLKIGRLSLGKNVSEMEKRFAKYLKIKYAVAVSSATAGLHISLLSSNIKQSDEVIVPPKTFISTANAVIYCNAKPIFCDVDEDSFNLDPKKLQKLITKKTRAIIPVHIGGNICHMDEILEIATKNNLAVIEDAAHAHGATLQKKKAGTFGDLGVFSFYPDKVMASSDGGIIVTNNKSASLTRGIFKTNVSPPFASFVAKIIKLTASFFVIKNRFILISVSVIGPPFLI